MPWAVEGKVAVISGASSSMGVEISRRLAKRGMKLALLSRDPGRIPALQDSAQAAMCESFGFDILKGAAESDNVMKTICKSMGPVSALVNCAGVTLNKMHVRCSEEDYLHVMNTNVRGSLDLTRAALRHGGLLQTGPRGGAAVVHIGSVVGVSGNAGQVLYSASKAALSGAARSWAKEYGAKNIRFNVVAPGLVEGKGMSETLSAQQREQWIAECPLGRLATPEDVADVVELALLSSYLSGQTIVIDGGSY